MKYEVEEVFCNAFRPVEGLPQKKMDEMYNTEYFPLCHF